MKFAPAPAPTFEFSKLPLLLDKTKDRPRDYAMLCLIACTGMRPCELPALTWKHCANADGSVGERITWQSRKGGAMRNVELNPRTREALATWRDTSRRASNTALLFPGVGRSKLSDSAVRVAIIAAMKRAGFDASAYSLRHMVLDRRGERCAKAGGTVRDLMQWSGHRAADSVAQYLDRHSAVAKVLATAEDF